MASHPIIKPIKTKEFKSKQSQYEHCAKLPMRALVLGPSGSGKTVLLQNMILDIYRDCFCRIYIYITLFGKCQYAKIIQHIIRWIIYFILFYAISVKYDVCIFVYDICVYSIFVFFYMTYSISIFIIFPI